MSDDKYSRRISMQCSTCGGEAFDRENEAGPYRCKGCDRIYTREQLLSENGGLIESEVDEVKVKIVQDFRETLRKGLSGSQFIKIK